MAQHKHLFAIFACTFLTISLYAKEYVITSGAVTCTLETLSAEQMLETFGVSSKRYMVVLTTFHNDSEKTVRLKKNGYITNIDAFFAPKEYLLSQYHDKLKSLLPSLVFVGGATWAGFTGTIIKALDLHNNWDNLLYRRIWGVGETLFCAMITLYFGKKLIDIWDNREKVKEKIEEIPSEPPKPGEKYHTLAPGETQRDWFLVDLSKTSRDVFDEKLPTLIHKDVS